jgi:hypothetical protein
MKYAFDADQNLVRGDKLTFAYYGSGVATLIDEHGTGYKVVVGTRNLRAVITTGDNTQALVLEDESKSTVKRQAAQGEGYAGMKVRELKAIADERGIPYPFTANKAALGALLEAADKKEEGEA